MTANISEEMLHSLNRHGRHGVLPSAGTIPYFFAEGGEPIAPHVDVDDAFSTPSPQILPDIL